MNSVTTPEFWKAYAKLNQIQKEAARKAYSFWHNNPFHPSLRFKCINTDQGIWSVRVSRSHRAVCTLVGDTAIWFWIGDHDEYEKFFG